MLRASLYIILLPIHWVNRLASEGMRFYLTIQDETVIVRTIPMIGEKPYHQTIHLGEAFNGIPEEKLRTLAEQEGVIEIFFPSEWGVSH